MRTDETHDEAEARMDAMTDRIRALEKERDAYKRAKAENDARFQRERDEARAAEAAAVKRAEEAERGRAEAQAREGRLRADLREWATPPSGMGAGLHAETWPALMPSARRRMLRLAALSLSPVSGAAAPLAADDQARLDWAWEVHSHPPTHRCRICGALWRFQLLPGGSESWTLRSRGCGPCCDNAPMVDQIEPLPLKPVSGAAAIERLRVAVEPAPPGPDFLLLTTAAPGTEAPTPPRLSAEEIQAAIDRGREDRSKVQSVRSPSPAPRPAAPTMAAAKEPSGVAGDRCEPGNECGRTGCEECQR